MKVSKLLLLVLFMAMAGCASAKPPLVRVETITVRVPVKPDIPEETLAACLPKTRLPAERDPTVGEVETWAEDLSVALEKCNKDKAAISRAISAD